DLVIRLRYATLAAGHPPPDPDRARRRRPRTQSEPVGTELRPVLLGRFPGPPDRAVAAPPAAFPGIGQSGPAPVLRRLAGFPVVRSARPAPAGLTPRRPAPSRPYPADPARRPPVRTEHAPGLQHLRHRAGPGPAARAPDAAGRGHQRHAGRRRHLDDRARAVPAHDPDPGPRAVRAPAGRR